MSEKYAAVKVEMQLHKPPVFKEPTKDGQLVVYGDTEIDLPYPDYLIDLSQRSPRHGAILKGKVRYICGNGWEVDTFQKTTLEVYELQRLLGKPNEDESFNELTNNITNDFVTIGGFAIECIWNKAGSKISEFAHVPVSLIRAVWKTDHFTYCYLPDWRKIKTYEQAKKKEGFKEWEVLGTNKSGSELLYVTEKRPVKSGECNVYGLPDYISGITLIEADAEIGNFRLNNIKNGFWTSKIISFANGVPPQEEQRAIKKALTNQHQGSDNAGTWALLFSDGGNLPTVLDMTGGDLDKQFVDVDKAIETGIGTSHGVTSQTIFGVSTPGSLGQRNEMLDAYSLFNGNYIVPKQQIIEDAINYIFSFNKVEANLKLKPVGILANNEGSDSRVLTALNTMSPLVATKVLESMSAEEIRDLVGLGLKKGFAVNKFIKEESFTENFIYQQFESMGEITPKEKIIKVFELEKDDDGYKGDDYYLNFAKKEDFENSIMSIMKGNPKVTPEEIAQALDTDLERVERTIGQLIADEFIKGEPGNFEVLEDVTVDVGVRYRYSGPMDSKNREFCAKMIRLSNSGKTWSRKEIDSIKPSPSAPDEPFSVFDYRGGFWTRKGTNETTPYCRHKWEAVAVRL